tara:strand:- start:833 stop:1318 length:486 start_codon:yes stop_codon:yes gene_type:complete
MKQSRLVFLFITIFAFLPMVGCVCNHSRLHSALSDEVIERRLATKFKGVETQEQRNQKALELVDQTWGSGVFAETDGTSVHFVIPFRAGCQFFWPNVPAESILVHFDDKNQYVDFDRWDLNDHPNTDFRWNGESLEYRYRGKEMRFDRVENIAKANSESKD